MNEFLMLIPARGGSKSIPRKNIRLLAGKPLIAWTIEAALASSVKGRVIVSTDDAEIADTARAFGAEVPFLRPPHLAQDETPGIDPLLHAVEWLEMKEHYAPDHVMLLQPTSPLREACDIEAAVELARDRQADAVISMREAKEHPYWMKGIGADGRLTEFTHLDDEHSLRQSLPDVYSLNGAIYLIRREVLIEQRTLYPERTYAYVMPSERSIDIDTPWDLYLAGLILTDKHNT